MTPIYIDFETYWDTHHTLSKMPPTQYVMSPLTEIISMAIKVGDAETEVVFGDEIAPKLAEIDFSDAMAIGHNMSGFDSMILAWRFGVRPKMWGCTAAMARSKHAKTCGVSLAKLVAEYELGVKDNSVLMQTKGRYLKDFTPEEIRGMRKYNKADTDQCAGLFKQLLKGFPKAELWQLHMTVEMLVNPQFELDTGMVEAALSMERDQKLKALLELDKVLHTVEERAVRRLSDGPTAEEFVRSTLASATKFGELLQSRGVDVPMKPSPTNPGKMTPALAKTDEAFLNLQEHPDPVVAMAAATRLSVKSTILETRLQAFLDAAAACNGKLPVPLRYCGADTTGRWSGEQYNMQNLPRIDPKKIKPSDALRNALKAPKGYKVVVSDLSGIELRVNMFLWKVPYAMALFQNDPEKADLYRYFAAHSLYNVEEDAIEKWQRQVGKVSHLGLGFGAGPATFQKVAKLMGGINMDLEESTRVVETYRSSHREVVLGWRAFQDNLNNIRQGIESAIDPWGMCVTEKNAVRLPSGRRIYYPSLIKENDNGKYEWWYGHGRHRARIYAGKGVENLVQALARDVIADNALAIYKATKLLPVMMVHDELVYIVKDEQARDTLDTVNGIMRTPPKWWPELITWSEGDIASCYGAAK